MKQLIESTDHKFDFNLVGKELFNQIIFQAPVAITITDQKGDIQFINSHFTEITGYSESELIGVNSSILSYKITPKRVYQELWDTITAGQCWQGQLINKRKNGSLYIADLTISPIEMPDGNIYYYSVQNDITEQHELNTDKQNQSAMLQTVLNSAPVSLFVIDDSNNILFKNQRYEALEQELSRSPIELIVETLSANYATSSILEFSSKSRSRYISLHIPGSCFNEERWFDCSVAQLPVTDTTIEKYFQKTSEFYSVLSITERTKEKNLVEERRLNAVKLMTSESKHVHGMQEALMATVHQLQGPFNMIDSAIKMLRNTHHSCPGLDAMDEALTHGVDALKQINQAIPERPVDPFQAVNINQVIQDVTSISTQRLLNESIRLDLHLTATLPSINAKPTRLLLAFKQLLDNAVEAIQNSKPSERAIMVSTKMENDDIIVVFEDSGAGIDEAAKVKVFQPFFSTKPKHYTGCRGIGLAIVQQVINEHSAVAKIESSKRLGGASIIITIPKNGTGGELCL